MARRALWCALAAAALARAAEYEPVTRRPLLRAAAAASESGGLAAAERVLVEAALRDGAEPTAWVGLGMLHAQTGRRKEAAATLWAGLERLVAARRRGGGGGEGLAADEAAVGAMVQAELTKPPCCARLLCPARSDDVREVSSQVSDCLAAAPLSALRREEESAPYAWAGGVEPMIADVDGPAALLPLSAGGHVMITRRPQHEGDARAPPLCAVWPAEHLSFRLFSDLREDPSLLKESSVDATFAEAADVVVPRGSAAASVLHALDTRTFFHFLREGVVPSLLLLDTRLPLLLLPDTTRWRAWIEALRPSSSTTELLFVPPRHSVFIPSGATLSFAPAYDMRWLSEMSGAALLLVRARLDQLPPPAACAAPEDRRVVYVSRNDSSVRAVHREGKLLEALRSAARVDGWSFDAVLLSQLPFDETRALLRDAAAVVGPHGAGLFNAPLFAPPGARLIAFGLEGHDVEKEDNLRAACQAVGMELLTPPGVAARFVGNYTLTDRLRAAVVQSVRQALRGS
ncbi:hypothetical protein AB1Y20_004206 [Prymnesium parvum]|uniref:Glycosyltransferase 61 catalytic domain-containing protein n=1 Tax=Prymnesium parvum TaxID=97485 RepID=A0AB34J9L9_PRYPA